MKKIYLIFLVFIVVLFSVGCAKKTEEAVNVSTEHVYKIDFVDDDGREIKLDKPCEKIISLYSAHTENLYFLGAESKIIGVGESDKYPEQVKEKDVFSYKGDAEKIIAAQPDLVLIRPFITRRYPDFVKKIEELGITVISLYTENFDDFDSYINKLALITGTEENAEKALKDFHEELDYIAEITKSKEPKSKIFFEATSKDYNTVTKNSMAGKAIELAGGENAAGDLEAVRQEGSIAVFGIERVLSIADNIDVYVAQKGAMNSEVDVNSIKNRSGFDTTKAVKEDKVYTIDEKIISAATFRYSKGVRELANYMYPELFNE